jgi:putative ABC transport system permease protein
MSLPLKYHWRNLFVRRTTTLLTVLVVAAVVSTLTWLLGFVFELRGAMAVASDPHKLVVLQRGAISETNSSISPDEYNRLSQLADVEVDPDSGTTLISPEMFWQTQLPRIRDKGASSANVAVRGVTPIAFKVHKTVHLVEGRMFSTGEPEVIVGKSAAKQFAGLETGASLSLGWGENRSYRVVGIFSADGGPLESEIWAYLPSLQSAYSRTSYSAANMRLKPDADIDAVIKQIEGSAIQLSAQREGDYWRAQSQSIVMYQRVCYVLVGMMGIAAVFSIANTMFAAVAGRSREVAMLRTIGYKRHHIMSGFVIEAVMLALIGGVAGCIACALWLEWIGHTKDMINNNSFTSLALEIHLTPTIVVVALGVVAIVGAAGALVPAGRAARMATVSALRDE